MPDDFDVRATGLSDKTIKQIYDVLVRFPSLEKAVVYGSRAKGNYEEGSDIDLTLWGDKSLHDDLWEITSALNHGGIGYEFDVSIFDELDHAKLRDHINKHGKLFYERKKALGWEVVKLGELLKVQNGFAFSAQSFSATDGIPIIRIRDLANGKQTSKRYKGDYSDDYIVRKGDILIGMDGEFRCHEWQGKNALLNQRVCRLQEFSSQLLPRFLYYGIGSFLKSIEDGTSYTTVKHLSSKSIEKIPFSLPPMEVQKEIVAKLDNIFAQAERGLESARRNAENADALFQSYLRDVFESRDENWQTTTLGEVCEFRNGFAFKSKKFAQQGTPVVRIGDIKNNEVSLDNVVFSNQEDYSNNLDNYRVETGDLLIAMSGATTGKLGLNLTGKVLYQNQRVGKFLPRSNLCRSFLHYFLTTRIEENLSISAGSAQPNLNTKQILSIEIPLPPIKTQHTIVAKLNNISAETQKLKEKYSQQAAAFEALKASVLRQAFAGKLTREIAA